MKYSLAVLFGGAQIVTGLALCFDNPGPPLIGCGLLTLLCTLSRALENIKDTDDDAAKKGVRQ